jgi:hypothetical protein
MRLNAIRAGFSFQCLTEIHHFYHVYADGKWQEPVAEHLLALVASGLARADGFLFKIGLVGSEKNAAAVRDFLTRQAIPWREVNWCREGWEQVTLSALARESQTAQGVAFYAHTKGAFVSGPFNTEWRRRMTDYTVTRWRDALRSLETHQAYGCHWMKLGDHYLFGGNFWWARMSDLRLLPPPQTHSRWAAEGWIGQLPRYLPKFSVCDPAPPFPGKIDLPGAG